ncbi:hypothetical protein BROUX41_001507 [Berkeleyomyces rouxiae]|uniref:uncharacterized protein n=1 Tax=Berkeleyomyces rouxiae TaxID=2035830 RepID=UPI003B7A8005
MAAFGPLSLPRVHNQKDMDPIIESLMYKLPEVPRSKTTSLSNIHDSPAASTEEVASPKRIASSSNGAGGDGSSVKSGATDSTLTSLRSKLRKSFSSRH